MTTPISPQKLLFVIPAYKQYGRGRYVMPLGIMYVAAAAKRAGVEICTINLNHETGDETIALSDCIQKNGCTAVALGGLSGEYADLYNVLRHVKQNHPHITTLVGGGIITASPKIAMQALEYADIGIIGEGDETIVDLMLALEGKHPVSSVNGIIYRENGNWVLTPRRRDVANLDTLPMPYYEGFDFAHYLATNNLGMGNHGEPLSPINIVGSRSCPYLCSFCFHPSGRTYRERSMDSIFSEIEYLLKTYPGINHIAMREELFASRKERIRDFCNRISKYNIYWTIQLRVDNIDEEVLQLLAHAGCFAVFLGTESMDNTVLRSMNKRVTAEQSQQALQLAAKHGVPIRTGLIFGDKAETSKSWRHTLEWYLKQDSFLSAQQRPSITVDILIPFPGSPIYRYACQQGIITNEEEYLKQGCPIVNLTSMSETEFLTMLRTIQAINGRTYKYLNHGEYQMIFPPEKKLTENIVIP